MTAELEEQEKKAEKEVEVEKTPSPQDEKAPQNGGEDLKKDVDEKEEGDEKPDQTDDEKKKAAEAEEDQKEEEEVEVVPKKKAPGFFARLFRRGKMEKQDVEAGTELLSKESKAAEIKAEEANKAAAEKNGSKNDVGVAVEASGDAEGKDTELRDANQRRSYWWKRVAAGLVCIIIVLVAVSVVSIFNTSGQASRGPMGEALAITDCGPVKGYKEDGIYVFKGVPYALPPVGELRWKPPMQASNLNDCWTGTFEANKSSAICFQQPIPGHPMEMSEDCLYLDIITPSLSPPVLRSVVVYIPGYHPLKGYSAEDVDWRPNAAIADAKDVTFVTINYRTNVFGFLVLDLLTNRMRPPTSGNYGIQDMIAALKWVQRNIRSFGGDPDKVTVLAHGGAATAGLTLLSSKKADGLFSQMWLTSPSARFSNKTLEQVGADNAGILEKLNCDSLSCLYNKTSEEILAATPGSWAADWSTDLPSSEEEQYPNMAVIDGDVLRSTPFDLWKEGEIQRVPVVIGSAAQESGSSKVNRDLKLDTWSWTDFSDYVSEKLQTISENVTVSALQFYIQNDSTPLQQFHTMVSDVRTICPLGHLNDALGAALVSDSYWYLVDYKPSSPVQLSNDSSPVRLSVHGLDIAAIFGILDRYVRPMGPSDVTFQRNLQELFYSFVSSGRPKIRGDDLMAADFINMIGDTVRSTMTPYENCHLWAGDLFYPAYAKMN